MLYQREGSHERGFSNKLRELLPGQAALPDGILNLLRSYFLS